MLHDFIHLGESPSTFFFEPYGRVMLISRSSFPFQNVKGDTHTEKKVKKIRKRHATIKVKKKRISSPKRVGSMFTDNREENDSVLPRSI